MVDHILELCLRANYVVWNEDEMVSGVVIVLVLLVYVA